MNPSPEVVTAILRGEEIEIPTAMPGARFPWFPLYPTNLLASSDVAAMTAEQFGWYIKLLCRAWDSSTPGFLPNDHSKLWVCAAAKSQQRFEQLGAIVLRKFVETQDHNFLFNRRLLRVRFEQEAKARKLTEAGRVAGLASAKRRALQRSSPVINGRSKTVQRSSTSQSQSQIKSQRKTRGDSPLNATDLAYMLVKYWQEQKPKLLTGFDGVVVEAEKALLREADREAASLESIAEQMKHALTRYFDSPLVKNGDFAWQARAWFADGHYRDKPESWTGKNKSGHPLEGVQGYVPLPPDYVPASKRPENAPWVPPKQKEGVQ